MNDLETMSAENAIGFFQRHLVPIYFSFKNPEGKFDSTVITSFVLSVKGVWFLVTAGHCLEEINNLISNGFEIKDCMLFDSGALGAKHNHPIPFHYDKDSVGIFGNERDFDYGAIVIESFYKELLKKNNISPLDEKVWKLQPSKADKYFLLGVPNQLVYQNNRLLSISTKMLPIEMQENRPQDLEEKEAPRVYGKISLGTDISSIKGMSGGPIFAFQEEENGNVSYWLYALQSTWNQGTRNISACPTTHLGLFIEEIIEKSRNKTPP